MLSYLERIAKGESIRVVVHCPPRHGKAVANDTPMLTRDGWKTAGDVVVGDVVVGSDGDWTRVRGVFPQGAVGLLRVTFSDGSSIVTSGDHRWSVEQRYGGPPVVKTTLELESDITESDGRRKWRIPVAKPIAGAAVALHLDPYLLGLWLGDGSSYKAEITTMDQEILDAIGDAGFETSYEYPTGLATTYGILGLQPILKAMRLLKNHGGEKHVPDSYSMADAPVRLAVLQGMADTDGTVAKNGSQQSVTTTSERLAVDIKFLVNSLGGVWTEYARRAAKKIAHTIHFRLPDGMSGFRLERKKSRLMPFSPRNAPRRFVASVESAGTGHATCFEVEAGDHLFCAGRELIVTHNTETLLHAIPWFLKARPDWTVGYCSYSQAIANSKSRVARALTGKAGINLDVNNVTEWRTAERGGVLAVGIGGGLIGYGVNVLMVDDPVKNRIEAESSNKREAIKDWFQNVALTRVEPGGSVIVNMQRWHTDDLAGFCISKLGWEYLCLPAIDDDGAALWPERWSVEELTKRRTDFGEYVWSSLYQGQPIPRGGSVFGDPYVYDEAPTHYRVSIGIDMAYSKKTSSDYSVAVVMAESDGHRYVLDVVRKQCRAPDFLVTLYTLWAKYPSANFRWYASGTELGTADFLTEMSRHPDVLAAIPREMRGRELPLDALKPKGDKFTRAIGYAAKWNAHRVLVPVDAPWADQFVTEHVNFSGVNDAHDDQVDAAVAASDELEDAPIGYGNLPRLEVKRRL